MFSISISVLIMPIQKAIYQTITIVTNEESLPMFSSNNIPTRSKTDNRQAEITLILAPFFCCFISTSPSAVSLVMFDSLFD